MSAPPKSRATPHRAAARPSVSQPRPPGSQGPRPRQQPSPGLAEDARRDASASRDQSSRTQASQAQHRAEAEAGERPGSGRSARMRLSTMAPVNPDVPAWGWVLGEEILSEMQAILQPLMDRVADRVVSDIRTQTVDSVAQQKATAQALEDMKKETRAMHSLIRQHVHRQESSDGQQALDAIKDMTGVLQHDITELKETVKTGRRVESGAPRQEGSDGQQAQDAIKDMTGVLQHDITELKETIKTGLRVQSGVPRQKSSDGQQALNAIRDVVGALQHDITELKETVKTGRRVEGDAPEVLFGDLTQQLLDELHRMHEELMGSLKRPTIASRDTAIIASAHRWTVRDGHEFLAEKTRGADGDTGEASDFGASLDRSRPGSSRRFSDPPKAEVRSPADATLPALPVAIPPLDRDSAPSELRRSAGSRSSPALPTSSPMPSAIRNNPVRDAASKRALLSQCKQALDVAGKPVRNAGGPRQQQPEATPMSSTESPGKSRRSRDSEHSARSESPAAIVPSSSGSSKDKVSRNAPTGSSNPAPTQLQPGFKPAQAAQGTRSPTQEATKLRPGSKSPGDTTPKSHGRPGKVRASESSLAHESRASEASQSPLPLEAFLPDQGHSKATQKIAATSGAPRPVLQSSEGPEPVPQSSEGPEAALSGEDAEYDWYAHEQDVDVEAELRLFTEPEGLQTCMEGLVRLLRASYVVELAEQQTPLPALQHLPEGALWPCAEAFERLCDSYEEPWFYVLSYRWLNPDHPDPDCHTLTAVSHVLQLAINDGGEDKALFWDFASLPQRIAGVRSIEEQKCFEAGIKHMHLLFAHDYSRVLLHHEVPVGHDPAGVESSGWLTFESAVSSLLKESAFRLEPSKCTEDITMMEFLCSGAAQRKAPMTTEDFNRELETKAFAEAGDRATLRKLYQEAFEAATGAEQLSFQELRWGDEDMTALARSLPRFRGLRRLHLDRNEIGQEGLRSLTPAIVQLGSLQELILNENPIGADAVAALAPVLAGMATLEFLGLYDCGCEDDATQALLGKWLPNVEVRVDRYFDVEDDYVDES